MAQQQDVGQRGEDLAVAYLQEHGHLILHRNWRHRHEEVDIVSCDGQELVFTEVKCRSGMPSIEPYRAVNQEKQRFLIRAANAYIRRYRRSEEVRFDVVSIELGPPVRITHIPRAFFPTVARL